MIHAWKRLWARRPRLSRGQKTVRNLMLCVLILLWFWGLVDYPLPTAEMEFRRMERTRLIPRSEIVFANMDREDERHLKMSERKRSVYSLDGTELYLRDQWSVGLNESCAVIARVGKGDWDRDIWTVPLEEEGPTLLTFCGGYGYWKEENPWKGVPEETHNFFPILLVNVPEETTRAEITIWQGEDSVTGLGWNMGNGAWLMTPDNQVLLYQREEEQSYTLRLYRTDGALLLEQNGTYWEG